MAQSGLAMGRKPEGDQPLTSAQRMTRLRERRAEECKQLREAVKFVKTWDARLTESEQRIDAVLARMDKDQ